MIEIINNGIFSHGNNMVVWVRNNEALVANHSEGKKKRFNDRKSIDASTIKDITVKSSEFDIHLSVSSKVDTIEATLSGEASIDGTIYLGTRIVNNTLTITAESTAMCYDSNVCLNITVPQKVFTSIAAESVSGNIDVGNILVKTLNLSTVVGTLESHAIVYNNIFVYTVQGNANLHVDAEKDIFIQVVSETGNVSVNLNNIAHINSTLNTLLGNIENKHSGKSGYTALVDIDTSSGDITIS